MQCKSCESEINPQWKHATENNICPFCGAPIMDEELCQVFEALREVLGSAFKSIYSDQVKDWLCSNYSLIPSDKLKENLSENDILEYIEQGREEAKAEMKGSVLQKMNQVKLDDNDDKYGVLVGKQSDERNSEFFKRAEVPLENGESVIEKTQRLKSEHRSAKSKAKEMVAKIQDGQIKAPNIDSTLEGINQLYPDNDTSDNQISDLHLEDESIPSHIANMAAISSGSNKLSKDHNAKDMMALENLQNKSRGLSGNGVFRRS